MHRVCVPVCVSWRPPRWFRGGTARLELLNLQRSSSPAVAGFRGARGRAVPSEPRSRLTLPQVHADPRHALVLDPCSLPRWVHSHPLPLALPRGRRLQPPRCPLSAGAWLLLLPRLARAEGAGELDAGGGGREDRVSPRRLRTCGWMRGWRAETASSHLQRFFHAGIPGVGPCLLPGRKPRSLGTLRPELLHCSRGWGQLVPAHRGGLLTSWSHLVRSPCCAFVHVTPVENGVGGSHRSLGAAKEFVPRVEVRGWLGVFSAT